MKRAIGYSRVSTEEQDYQRQVDEIKRYSDIKNYQLVQMFSEKISGRVKNSKREQIQRLLELVRKQKVDVVVVSEISRLGRNVYQVQTLIEELSNYAVSIEIMNLGISTLNENGERNPIVDLMVNVVSSFSSIESDFLSQRVKSGMQKAKQMGKHIGRPTGKEPVEKLLIRHKKVVKDIKKGAFSLTELKKLHGISVPTIIKLKKAIAQFELMR